MVRAYGFDEHTLRDLLAAARTNQEVVRAVSAPATSRPWYQFKPLCVDETQIAEGVRFWNENAEVLERARRDFGVPESIIVAVIGIESRYGRYAGGFRVLDALYTLSFEWAGGQLQNRDGATYDQILALAQATALIKQQL